MSSSRHWPPPSLARGAGSCVLATTAAFLAALPELNEDNGDAVHRGAAYVHCQEPMSADPELRGVQWPVSTQAAPTELLSAYFRTRVHTGPGKEAPATYAHSYIGFGLTPVMAIDIEKGSKGAIKEMFSVIRTFAKFKPFEIRQTDGKRRKFDSLVLANIPEMAKYATLSDADNHPSDGKFEVIHFPHMPKWRVLLTALRATTQGLGDQPSVSTYEFTTLKPLPYQIDGEVKSVDANTLVKVESAPAALPILG